MLHHAKFRPSRIAAALCLLSVLPVSQAQQTTPVQPSRELEAVTVIGTAAEEQKEALGVSVITAAELEKRPPASDLAEILRREPGVNLTGSAASGMRGNRRQLDIRGMGPDNTMVLIDGRPANSRNASRQGWTGERDTDGDTGWVPPEAIERVEILRGPAAARYGSGAMGGVVNIITKKPTDEFHGSVTTYNDWHQDSDEGNSRRVNFLLSGPAADKLGFRLYGGYAKTSPDDLNINEGHGAYTANGITGAAGKTGKRDKFVNGELVLDIDSRQSLELDLGFSRKSDLYSGDTQNLNGYETGSGGTFTPVNELWGSETTIVYRTDLGLTHKGTWDWGVSNIGLSYGYTRNSRDAEGLFGGPEGAFLGEGQSPQGRYDSRFKEWRLDGDVSLPLDIGGIEQMLTLGGEFKRESLDDPGSLRALALGARDFEPVGVPGRDGDSKVAYNSFAIWAEDNIRVTEAFTLTPTVRFNHHQEFGNNVSPGLTASYAINDVWTVRGGIARAYKTPNLYQANPNYLLYSRGNGCRGNMSSQGGCYLQGNADLKSETSINKEIGFAYDDGIFNASLAYFRNDYKNKIVAGVDPIGQVELGTQNPYLLQWVNTPKAEVSGLEGNVFIPFTEAVSWNTNFTYMISSKDKTYNQPLSIIPKYTVNSWLDWAVNERLSLQANLTWYGKQEPATFDVRRGTDVAIGPGLNPYALVGVNGGYEISKNFSVRLGINNLFNKKLYRQGLNYGTGNTLIEGAGARTYNEHGRSYFLNLTARF
ncbi:FepA family TonB-dependent siderophore receptor [Pseudomonas sp. S 311-6]|uniref:FepA family TonB-dependent siderophore receptor n=1 Tax=Kerstersia gyiorum TaxID=206506 RepID=UPI002097BBB9|nr:FepA family TonB-dependent siderophore receptor [Pseudomonas sp. S 311-6]